MEILAVRNLTFTYPECSSPALKNISLSLERGEFAVLCGATGSGKSTLLRMIKRELTPLGEMSGDIVFNGSSLSGLDSKVSASAIGFVMQNPEHQTVTDKVWHELAFGLENLGTPPDEIARRIAEMASYFGIVEWYDKDTAELMEIGCTAEYEPERAKELIDKGFVEEVIKAPKKSNKKA